MKRSIIVLLFLAGCGAGVYTAKSAAEVIRELPDISPVFRPQTVADAFTRLIDFVGLDLPESHWTAEVRFHELNYVARDEAFALLLGVELGGTEIIYCERMGDEGCTAKDVDLHWRRQGVLEALRTYLKDPAVLKAAYEMFRQPALDLIGATKLVPRLKKHLAAEVAPCFRPIPAEMAAAERLRLEHETAYWESNKLFRQCTVRFGYDAPECAAASQTRTKKGEALDVAENATRVMVDQAGLDLYAFQWRGRRHAEGGDALVRAWGEIIADFADRL